MKLNNQTLSQLPAQVLRPGYDRSQVQPGIVHLGVGAFLSALLAVLTVAVLASGDLRGGIVGAGMVSDHMKNAVLPQDGLFTLIERSAAGERLRVIGSIIDLLAPPGDIPRLLDLMSAPGTRIVSLTVTEKGYYIDPASGELLVQAPAIQQDLADVATPRTVLGLIVRALARRRAAGIAPFTVLSCDNLVNNGKRAKAAVLAFARQVDVALADWIAAEVRFPCTMVDRITPATTDAERSYLAALGLDDAWPVVTEEFVQWVIEDDFTLGRPDWTIGGAFFSDEIETWEAMKLRCLNGAHSTLAYMGQLCGQETVDAAMATPLIAKLLDALWAEVLEVLHAPKGVDANAYVDSLKQRFRNPSLKHRTQQIAMDGSQKLPVRLLGTLRDRIARGLRSPALTTAVAAWMHYVVKTAATPEATLNDPMSAELLALVRGETVDARIVDRLLSVEKIFGTDLPRDTLFRAEVLAGFAWLADEPGVSTAPAVRP